MDIVAFAEKFGNLFIKSKYLVDGLYQGKHRSITHGYSVEFTEHRPYEIGDDIRFIDWKVYARTDRYMVKKFTEETELDVYFFLDTSGSMAYEDKFYNSILLTGALMYLFHIQNDRISLFTPTPLYIPPTRNKNEVMEIFRYLEEIKPQGNFEVERAFSRFSSVVKKRGFIIIVSDFLFELDYLDKFLRYMRKKHRQVIGFWILSDKERRFPFVSGAYFRGLEENEKLKVNPSLERKVYLKKLKNHSKRLKETFDKNAGVLIVPEGENIVEDSLLKFFRSSV